MEKLTECVRNRFDSDTNKVIVNAAYGVLNSFNVNEDTSEVATEDVEDSTSDNFSICESSESDDEILSDGNDGTEQEVIVEEGNDHLYTEIDASIDLLAKQFENPLLNADVAIPSSKFDVDPHSTVLKI